jgi:hypothetical protein
MANPPPTGQAHSGAIDVVAANGACGNPRAQPEPAVASAPRPMTGREVGTTVTTAARPGLARRVVQRHIEGRLSEIRRRCGDVPREIDRYETTLHLEIAASGRVEIARARGNHPLVDACVADLARSWRLDESDGRTVIEIPLVLQRIDDAR